MAGIESRQSETKATIVWLVLVYLADNVVSLVLPGTYESNGLILESRIFEP